MRHASCMVMTWMEKTFCSSIVSFSLFVHFYLTVYGWGKNVCALYGVQRLPNNRAMTSGVLIELAGCSNVSLR